MDLYQSQSIDWKGHREIIASKVQFLSFPMFDIHIENILRLCFLCSNSVIAKMHPNWRQRFKSMEWTIIWLQYTKIIKTSISSSTLLAYSFVIIPLPDISYEIKSNWFAYSKKEKVRLQLDGFSSQLIWVF